MALLKGDLREKLTAFLEEREVESAEGQLADELADDFVELMDEEGAFEEDSEEV